MPYFDFFWTDRALDKISQHGISEFDFERIVMNPHSNDVSRSSGHELAFGFVDNRLVCCNYEMLDTTTVFPITAFFIGE
jgi:hypothetical protein